MANYNQLKTRAQQVRDEQTIGGNTALRVGQLLMDMVDAESETVDNIVELFTGTEDNPVIPTLPNPGLLHWLQSPIVALVSMGEDLDGDAGAVVQEGDLYYYNHSGFQIFVKGAGGSAGTGYKARQNVIYINKYTGRIYEWDGADMSEIVLAGVGGGGNVTIEEGQDYINITIDDNVPVIEVSTQSIVMSGQTKTATFTVSGHNLTGAIRINGGNAYFSKSPSSISPVGGIVEATTVTVTFGGSTDDTDDLIVSSVGAASKTVHVTYSAVAGPNIVVSPATLSFKAAEDETETKQVSVQGSQLEADVIVSSDDSAFEVSLDGTTFNSSVTIPKTTAMAGATVYVRYTAGSSATTGTLTLESTGASSKTVTLTGAVATLTVTPQSLSFSTDQGVAVIDSFTIEGTNLTNGVSLSITGTNAAMFSLSKNSLTKAEAETGETITVTYTPTGSGDHSGNVEVSWDGAGKTITLQGTAAAATALDSNGRFQKGGIYYGAESDGNGGWTDNVKVYNSTYNTGATDSTSNKYSGVLNIPSTVTALKGSTETTFTVIGVAEYAFRGNTAITSITLPDTVTSMAAHILLGCTGLTYFNTGNGVTGLPYDFGSGLSALQELVIGDSVVDMKVNGSPFSGCSALRTVTLGSSVQRIGQLLDGSFANGVTTIICRGTLTKPVVNKSSLGSTSYKISNAANITVYIPSGTKSGEGGYLTVQDQQSNVISGYSAKTIWKYFDDNNRLIEQ